MTAIGWIQIILYCAIVVALVKPLGWYMTRVFNGERTFLSPVLRPVEAGIYWVGGVDEKREQHWLTYTVAMLLFHVGGFPDHLRPDAAAGLAAVQPGGAIRRRRRPVLQHRDLLHHQHQLAVLRRRKRAVLPDPDGRSDAPELPVGGDRHRAGGGADPRLRPRLMRTIGNFWVDVTRCTLYILLPICVVYALFLVSQGMPQTLAPMSTPPRWKAPSRPSRSARSRPRSRSRCSVPMAAASSTPTPRIRSKTRPRCRTSCR